MLKKITFLLLSLLLIGYIFFAVAFLGPKTNNGICKDVVISVKDTLERHFIDQKDIFSILRKNGLDPMGKQMKDIQTTVIEDKIAENKLVKRVECYKTIDNLLKIDIYQKIPLLRIISNSGNYYIDTNGEIMPFVAGLSAYLPVASGNIEKSMAMKELYEFALFLHDNKFWNTQIDQIYVLPNKEIELVPRVGNHLILLGSLDNYTGKLENLKLFYEKGLNKLGWNRYSKINLKYKNQIVCTKIQ